MTDYERLRQAAESATPGPWECDLQSNPGFCDAYVFSDPEAPILADGMNDADAEFIAAWNPATAIDLLDEIAALRRGQGTAPAPREPGPINLTPIPDSRSTT